MGGQRRVSNRRSADLRESVGEGGRGMGRSILLVFLTRLNVIFPRVLPSAEIK